ncbi:MAG: tetratricopeptide repeat protein [Bryobacteraceae bacterium]
MSIPLRHAIIAGVLSLAAALGEQLPNPAAVKAKQDFDKVDQAPLPSAADANACIASHAQLLAAIRQESRYLVHYRKGYCELFEAVVSGNTSGYEAANKDFTAAIATWPAKGREPIPPGLSVLPAIARLKQGRADAYPEVTRDLEAAVSRSFCPQTAVMSESFCRSLLNTGRVWLAWLAYQKNNVEEAARVLEPLAGYPWATWMSGRQLLRQGRPIEAIVQLQQALQAWTAAARSPRPEVTTLLGPRPDMGDGYYRLGSAELELKRYEAAVASFDAAIKANPALSHALYLRARAKEGLEHWTPASGDYQSAAQTARANDDASWAIGDAHFRRGMLLHRLKEYSHAQSEFAQAMGAKLTEASQGDLTAWRMLSAVAGGACQSALLLESSSAGTSATFPRLEAQALAVDCRLKQASTPEQLEAIQKIYGAQLSPEQMRGLRARLGDAYANQGVAAEDRKDVAAAVVAYRRAIQADTKNAKAHFNLGAIYIDDKRYNLAEAEYRALVDADANDYEAHYWLAESILAQSPNPERRTEACRFLKRSLSIQDAEKRSQFTKAFNSARCSP